MPTAAAIAALADRIRELGTVAYLVTVGPSGLPHVVSVRVQLTDGGCVVIGAGRHTSANVERRPDVTLLWPAPPGRGYCLIVDGTAEPVGGGLAVTPTVAKLHRTPDGDPSDPSCITVLDR